MRVFRITFFIALFLFLFPIGASLAGDKAWPIDHVIGRADAPITIIEYASLGCSHCAVFNSEVLPKLKIDWIDTGKARLIFRDFPLDSGSQAASMISQCSGDRYFSFVETFFKMQDKWVGMESPISVLTSLARFVGMTGDEVQKCLSNADMFKQLSQRSDEAVKSYGVNSTPSFVINGKLYSGAMEYDIFAKILSNLKNGNHSTGQKP